MSPRRSTRSRRNTSATPSPWTRSGPTLAVSTRSVPISCEVSVAPRTHGSGLFTRGQTQVLTLLTLGAARDEQRVDGLDIEESKRFMHHYKFPPFSVGEAGFMRGPGRREIGHGALAERALVPVVPDEEQFPYTIRLVSETLESNGSSSMASVCASTLAIDGRRRADRPPGGRHRHGSHQRGRRLRGAHRHRRAWKTTWATWTSRWPAPTRASPLCRWTSRSPA